MVLCFDSAPLSEAEIKDRTLKKRASLAAMSARNKKKLMLLGAGESGKSTIFKAVKVLYSGGYSPDERAQFTWIIHRNVIDGVQAILQGAQDMGHEVAEENEDLAERTLLYEGDNLNADLAADVAALWADPAVKRTFDERDAVQKQTMLHINDSAGYFLDDAARFAQPSYVPTEYAARPRRAPHRPAPARRHRARRPTAAPAVHAVAHAAQRGHPALPPAHERDREQGVQLQEHAVRDLRRRRPARGAAEVDLPLRQRRRHRLRRGDLRVQPGDDRGPLEEPAAGGDRPLRPGGELAPPLPPRLSAEEERHELEWEDAVTDRRFLAHVRAGGGGVRAAAEVDDDDEEGDTLEGMLAQSRARGRERGGRGARGRPRRY